MLDSLIKKHLKTDVKHCIEEDLGSGDITSQLIPPSAVATAKVIARQPAVICGYPWVEEVFRQLAPNTEISWKVSEGDWVSENSVIFEAKGKAREILTSERTALNYLQTLSSTATLSHQYAQLISHTNCKILDTRKTLPGLRLAQKYAVRCGGCHNHRIGLWDAYLIKENHIAACGSICAAVSSARDLNPDKPIEVEVETTKELLEAINAGADIVMLDNFDLPSLKKAVLLTKQRVKLEASGGVDESTLVDIAESGVDFISIGALTKHCQAIDLSMRFIESHIP